MVEALVLATLLAAGQVASPDGARISGELEQEAAGLLVRSETDAPLAGVVAGAAPAGEITVQYVLERFGYPLDAAVRVREIDDFLRPHASERAWHTREEARSARRFRRLSVVLRRTLRGLRVFEIGAREKHVLILGVTASGECVGLRTLVVET
jgi:hypothetical protein